MVISIPRETHSGERRVAVTPAAAAALAKDGHRVQLERSAGLAAGFADAQYEQAGATLLDDRAELIASADLVLQVRAWPANRDAPAADLESHRPEQVVIGFAEPLIEHDRARALAGRGVTLFAMELIPRITRAQAMDALSSQANLAGYKAVIRAADVLGKVFPMMMTAAGTIQPARVLIVGAGVAGLQAIATAKRLGAVVTAYDVRPAVKEQVQSLGAKFLELPLQTAGEDQGGYAKDQSEEQIHRQQELMGKAVAESDVVITTALIPGKKAPTLVTAGMVERMSPGSVIVDMAAEHGGNCELTRAGQMIDHNGVTIIGEENFAASAATHASLMYANNVLKLIRHLVKDDKLLIDPHDEVAAGALVCQSGEILHPRVREAMSLAPRVVP